MAEATVGEDWLVERTSCLGLCDRAPAALVDEHACGPLTPARVPDIPGGWRGEVHTYTDPRPGEVRVVLGHVGEIDPRSIDSALTYGVYQGLQQALQQSPHQVIAEIEVSGLRGRGGAGFPSGQKWRYVAREARSPKYVVCNADESVPLLFKDRVLLETNPHAILEGMLIAGHAVGAQVGFVYIRG
ncbi:MAG: NAD(P)H-dependent oxidoreductase subunit E, partial [Nitrospinae bacterium]|nr:NAD(P)H-dependent oxidoreductase subunit E [Nitrospinota bacterium]